MKNINEFTQISFWKALNPNLSISTTPFSTSSNAFKLEDAEIAQYLQYVIEEGYFDTRVVMEEREITDIANAIKSIVQYGLPPIFIFVYDEIWQIFSRLSNLLTPILGQNYKVLLAGMWAWHIDKDSAGFKPHRDLFDLATQPDGRPINLTVWLPFTDATPLNGCMYVLPTHLDTHHPDNLRYIQIDDVKNIRAIPAKAGSVLAWDASILHWGAKASCRASQPRISVAMDFMIDSPEAQDNRMLYAGGPDFRMIPSAKLSFQSRLNAIGEAIWIYRDNVMDYYPDDANILFDFCQTFSITPEVKSEASRHSKIFIVKKRIEKMIDEQTFSEALPIIEEGCNSHPFDVDAHFLLCKVMFALGKGPESVDAIKRALTVYPNNPLMRTLLSKVETSCRSNSNTTS